MTKREQTVTLTLECQLTDQELDRKRDELAAVIGKHHDLDEEKSEAVSRMNKELRAMQATAESLAEQIRAREERRPVECRRVMDAERQRVAVIRKDTGAVVDVRNMEPEEVERTQGEESFALEPEVSKAIESFAAQMRESEAEAEVEEEAEAADPMDPELEAAIKLIKGVGDAKVDRIRLAGYTTVDSILRSTPSDLAEAAGLTDKLTADVMIEIEAKFGGEGPNDSVDDILGI